MNIKIKVEGQTHEFNYEFPKSLPDCFDEFGADKVLAAFNTTALVAVKARVRHAIVEAVKAGNHVPLAIDQALNGWVPFTVKPKLTAVDKARKALAALTPEERVQLRTPELVGFDDPETLPEIMPAPVDDPIQYRRSIER